MTYIIDDSSKNQRSLISRRTAVKTVVSAAAISTVGVGQTAAENPTEIEDWYDFNQIREDPSGHYELTTNLTEETEGYNDVAASNANNGNGWVPIEADFTGVLDGNGYELGPIHMDRANRTRAAIFGGDDNVPEITDIGVEINFSLTDVEDVGGLCADTDSGSNRIQNTTLKGALDLEAVGRAGGIAGKARGQDLEVTDTLVDLDVTLEDVDAFGMVSPANNSWSSNDIIYRNVVSLGQITVASGSIEELSGLVAASASNSTQIVENCYSNVTFVQQGGSVEQAGGSAAKGRESRSSQNYEYTNVYAVSRNDAPELLDGGFIGEVEASESNIEQSNCYWDVTPSVGTTAYDAIGLTTSEMIGTSAEENMGFEFDTDWAQVIAGDTVGESNIVAEDDGYPVIRSVPIQPQLEAQDIEHSHSEEEEEEEEEVEEEEEEEEEVEEEEEEEEEEDEEEEETIEPPSAEFEYAPTNPDAGEQVAFDASGATAPSGEILAYEWEFGDGETASGETVSHVFDESGGYTVELSVVDENGESASTSEILTVEDDRSDSDDDETEITVPGFGVPSAIASLGGAGYLLKRRLSTTETDSE